VRPEEEAALGVEPVSFDYLVRESDFIIITCPKTPETLSMFGAEQFKAMKNTAFLINVGRGDVTDEKAFAEAVRNKEIAGGILLFFVLCAVGFVIYAKWYGHEKLLNKYKIHFIISGLILLISVYIYLLAIPDIVPNTIEDILIISGLIIIISAMLRYVYKLKQAGDLP
jgi:hypothetical protein